MESGQCQMRHPFPIREVMQYDICLLDSFVYLDNDFCMTAVRSVFYDNDLFVNSAAQCANVRNDSDKTPVIGKCR